MNFSELRDIKNYLDSHINSNRYYLTKDKIYVVNNEHIQCEIPLPRINDVALNGFYQMYYVGEEIEVIIDRRTFYDYSMILDEEKLTLKNLTLVK